MANLRKAELLGPVEYESSYRGMIVLLNGALAVNINGNVVAAKWADPLTVAVGDPVLVTLRSGRNGGSEAFVRCRLNERPRPGEATVKTVPPSSQTITVTGTDGTDYTATFLASYTPTVGDKVVLAWNGSVPSVAGKVSVTPAPPPPPSPVAPPPSAPQSGMTPYPASDSDTFWGPGGWGSWAGGGGRVFQGNFGSGEVYGAFFYAGSLAQLAGKNITRIRILLGDRLPVGSNNSPVTVHFYAHTSAQKPGGDVSRVAGPFDVTANPGQGRTEYDLPLYFASHLVAGGGVAIALNPYAGFKGRREQPDSGTLLMDWSA